jgi:hypothetical protein
MGMPPSDTILPNKESDVQYSQRWQERLLPLMVRMVVGLTLFFFIASLAQLVYLHTTIQKAPPLDLPKLMVGPQSYRLKELPPEFQALAFLEADVLERRYHQANVLLMSRVWARYLGFVTGMILSLVGAVFILGKLREEATELEAKGSAGAIQLRSTSPGLVMATLGVVLMIVTIVTHHEIATVDTPVYMKIAYSSPKPTITRYQPSTQIDKEVSDADTKPTKKPDSNRLKIE